MEINSDVLQKLICNICSEYLSIGPVLLLPYNGGNVCGRCYIPDSQETMRNMPYELLAEGLLFPCQYKRYGCTAKMSFATMKTHESDCKSKPIACVHIHNEMSTCKWIGPKNKIMQHYTKTHPESVCDNPFSFTLDTIWPSTIKYVLAAYNDLFVFHAKVCIRTIKIYHYVQVLSDNSNISNYNYSLEVQSTKHKFSIKGDVASQDCFVFEDTESKAVDITSLIGCLCGCTTTISFKLTIHSLVEALNCCKCSNCITYKLAYYMKQNEWYCLSCVEQKDRCIFSNRGCTYMDTKGNVSKHVWYFCDFRKTCHFCKSTFQGSLINHYIDKHVNAVYSSGKTWTEHISQNKCNDVVTSSDIGVLLFGYRYYKSDFVFYVRSAIPKGELHYYTCMLELQNPRTGVKCNKIMPLSSQSFASDWRVTFNELAFMTDFVHDNKFETKFTLTKTKF